MSPSSSAYREALLDALLCVESVNNVVFLVVEPPLVSICGVVVAISPPASVTFSAFVAASRQGWADRWASESRWKQWLEDDGFVFVVERASLVVGQGEGDCVRQMRGT